MTLRKLSLVLALPIILAACASAPTPYRQAASSSAQGYSEQPIETGRYNVSYRADDITTARQYALLRAAELTQQTGSDWFQIVRENTTQPNESRAVRPSVSVGGSVGSGGYSGVGIGIGIGIPGGARASNDVVHSMEILMGRGPQPTDANAYNAASVIQNMHP